MPDVEHAVRRRLAQSCWPPGSRSKAATRATRAPPRRDLGLFGVCRAQRIVLCSVVGICAAVVCGVCG
eukprot:7160835-Lingulodinium_polyedra.AAC.1